MKNITVFEAIKSAHDIQNAIRFDNHYAAPIITLKDNIGYILNSLKHRGCLTLTQRIGVFLFNWRR